MQKNIISIFIFFNIVLLLFSCDTDAPGSATSVFKDTEDIILSLKKRVGFNEKESIKYADIILDNQIYVWKFWEPYKYSKQINWESDPYNNPSWVL